MAGKAAKGAEVTKLHLSWEMMPQDPQVGYGSLGDLGMYCQVFDDIPFYSQLPRVVYISNYESFPNFENMPEAGRNLRSVSGTDAGIAWVIEFKDCIDLPLAWFGFWMPWLNIFVRADLNPSQLLSQAHVGTKNIKTHPPFIEIAVEIQDEKEGLNIYASTKSFNPNPDASLPKADGEAAAKKDVTKLQFVWGIIPKVSYMGFYGDLMGFYGDLMGFFVVT